jgi:hypothetical protein
MPAELPLRKSEELPKTLKPAFNTGPMNGFEPLTY